ncbi:MAG TPA: GGDEF domain-containing protein [Rubrivivax sp.]|nr:GGDEF domain-containing protein [Rubrivivax sp.]
MVANLFSVLGATGETGLPIPLPRILQRQNPGYRVEAARICMFGPKLDSLTLLLSISALAFVMAAIASSAAKTIPAYRPALRAWCLSMSSAGIGFFLFHMRGHAPWFLTFAVGNALVMLTAAYGLSAHCRLLEVRLPRPVAVLPSAVGLMVVATAYASDSLHATAVAAVSLAMASYFGTTAFLLARVGRERPRLLTVVSAVVMVSLSAALVFRAFVSAFGDPASIAPTATATPQVSLFLLGIVYVLTTSLWIFDTVHDRLQRATVEAARRDGLTGLYTRTAFFELASNVVRQQAGTTCAVVMLDIDHFKSINDAMGHAAGDAALAHAARLVAGAVRLSDVVGRYGGEEFSLLLPNCSALQAAELARRLVADAAAQMVRCKDGKVIRYTLSAGYAATGVPAAVNDPLAILSALLEGADQALYRAKREGRNRAVPAPAVLLGA